MKGGMWYVYQEPAPCLPVQWGFMLLGLPAQGKEEEPKVVWWHGHDRERRPGFQLCPWGLGPVSLTSPQHPSHRLKKVEEMTSRFPSNAGLPILTPTGDKANKSTTEPVRSLKREGGDNEVGQGLCEEPKKCQFQEIMPPCSSYMEITHSVFHR